MSKLTEGTKLQEITWDLGNSCFRVGEKDKAWRVKSITVSMEAGQMGVVPWALVKFHDQKRRLVNLALCEDVTLTEEMSIPKARDLATEKSQEVMDQLKEEIPEFNLDTRLMTIRDSLRQTTLSVQDFIIMRYAQMIDSLL